MSGDIREMKMHSSTANLLYIVLGFALLACGLAILNMNTGIGALIFGIFDVGTGASFVLFGVFAASREI